MDEHVLTAVAVLGGTGLIGRHVIAALSGAGTAVVATANRRPPFEAAGVEWRQVDLTTPGPARAALRGARAAVICAGRLSTAAELKRDPVGSVTTTLRIGINALEAAAAEGVERVVLVSSTTGYPPGEGPKFESAMFAGDPPGDWFGVGWVHRFLEKQLEWYCRLQKISAGVALRPIAERPVSRAILAVTRATDAARPSTQALLAAVRTEAAALPGRAASSDGPHAVE